MLSAKPALLFYTTSKVLLFSAKMGGWLMHANSYWRQFKQVYGAVHCGHPNDHSLLDQFQFCFHRNEEAAGGKYKEDDALTAEV